MFVRRTLTRRSDSGEHYYSHRLVRTERVAGRVRQVTLLNLGSELPLPPEQWPDLCLRIDEILHGHTVPPPEARAARESMVELEAQRLAALLLARGAQAVPDGRAGGGPARADAVRSPELVRVRTVGVEQVALWALGELRLAETLHDLGFPRRQVHAALGMIVAQMAAPGAEAAARTWWERCSALGELLEVDFSAIGPLGLYRAGDNLLKNRREIERRVLGRLRERLALPVVEPVFDLSHGCLDCGPETWFGERSRPPRSGPIAWPPVTLGLAVDASGFVQRSASFAGDGTDAPTLQTMLDGLGAPAGALAVMAYGAASSANLAWLRANGYGWLLVNRAAAHLLDPDRGLEHPEGSPDLRKVGSPDGKDATLYHDSPARMAKEEALSARRIAVLEGALRRLAEGIARPGGERRPGPIRERIRRLRERAGPLAQAYRIELKANAASDEATALSWERIPVPANRPPAPGILCLRTSESGWDAARMWDSFVSLSDLDAALASLRPGPSLRPFARPSEECSEARLFVSVLAYQCVQLVRRCLKIEGIDGSWQALRQILAGRCRVTVSLRGDQDQVVHLRTTSEAEPAQLAIYRALGIDPDPGCVRTTVL